MSMVSNLKSWISNHKLETIIVSGCLVGGFLIGKNCKLKDSQLDNTVERHFTHVEKSSDKDYLDTLDEITSSSRDGYFVNDFKDGTTLKDSLYYVGKLIFDEDDSNLNSEITSIVIFKK